MNLFKFKKKAKPESTPEPSDLQKDGAAFTDEANTDLSHFIVFTLNKESNGDVLLGKRTNGSGDKAETQYFIAFHDEQINNFLGEWYETLAACRKPNSILSENKDFYNTWVNQMLIKHSINIPKSEQNTDK